MDAKGGTLNLLGTNGFERIPMRVAPAKREIARIMPCRSVSFSRIWLLLVASER